MGCQPHDSLTYQTCDQFWWVMVTVFDVLLVANSKCDWCKFNWLGGYLDAAMEVHLLLTFPDLT